MEPNDVAVPAGIACSECGANVEQGYAPVDDGAVVAGEAACSTCAWTEIGMDGCAPELSDFEGDHDALVRLTTGDDGLAAEAVTEEA